MKKVCPRCKKKFETVTRTGKVRTRYCSRRCASTGFFRELQAVTVKGEK